MTRKQRREKLLGDRFENYGGDPAASLMNLTEVFDWPHKAEPGVREHICGGECTHRRNILVERIETNRRWAAAEDNL